MIINRVNSGLYSTTIKGVIFQKYNGNYQYDCVKCGSIYKEPSERATANAKAVLNGELYFPANVIGQAEFPQFSGTYDIVDFGRGLMYFSYSNKVK